ncbi:MAG: hypothetical protein HC906_02010 [Bacteroidales bacterium]|nr:hypothetical protein [Bacteroidales bacterium]
MEQNEISWCKWSIADKVETCSALKPGANAKGNWQNSELSLTGAYVRQLIRETNSGKKPDVLQFEEDYKKSIDK